MEKLSVDSAMVIMTSMSIQWGAIRTHCELSILHRNKLVLDYQFQNISTYKLLELWIQDLTTYYKIVECSIETVNFVFNSNV